jgi:hypothetical protein
MNAIYPKDVLRRVEQRWAARQATPINTGKRPQAAEAPSLEQTGPSVILEQLGIADIAAESIH